MREKEAEIILAISLDYLLLGEVYVNSCQISEVYTNVIPMKSATGSFPDQTETP